MDWVRDHYSRQSMAFGRAGVTERHRQSAALIHRLGGQAGERPRALELGAGACGLAGAMAELGYDVTAIEFNPNDVALARSLELDVTRAGLRVVEGDFYDADVGSGYDLVYYWDGFGVGSDSDQRRLLRRVSEHWLRPSGALILDVFSPWNWTRRHGEIRVLTGADGRPWNRRIEFDAAGCRMVDYVWRDDAPNDVLSQTIRLYSAPDLELLLEGTGLAMSGIHLMSGERLAVPPDDRQLAELSSANGFLAVIRRAVPTLALPL